MDLNSKSNSVSIYHHYVENGLLHHLNFNNPALRNSHNITLQKETTVYDDHFRAYWLELNWKYILYISDQLVNYIYMYIVRNVWHDMCETTLECYDCNGFLYPNECYLYTVRCDIYVYPYFSAKHMSEWV